MGINQPSGIRITLKVNKKNEANIFEDESVVLTVTLVNGPALTAASANAYHMNKINDLKKSYESEKISSEEYKNRIYELEKKLVQVKTFSFGGPEGWPEFIKIYAKNKNEWFKTYWPIKLLNYHPRKEVVNLNGKTSCIVEYGIDPEDPQKPKGQFTIKAVLEVASKKNIDSNLCTVNFLTKKMPKSEKELESTMLNLGKYAYKRLQFEKSMDYADSILKINPDSILAWSLKGEIEESRGDLDKADDAYSKSIEAFWKQAPENAEPPVSLIVKSTRVKSKKTSSQNPP